MGKEVMAEYIDRSGGKYEPAGAKWGSSSHRSQEAAGCIDAAPFSRAAGSAPSRLQRWILLAIAWRGRTRRGRPACLCTSDERAVSSQKRHGGSRGCLERTFGNASSWRRSAWPSMVTARSRSVKRYSCSPWQIALQATPFGRDPFRRRPTCDREQGRLADRG